MNSPLHLLVVDGKKITNTATLPVAKDGQPVHIKAVDGAKYLLSSGDNQPAPDHVVVKRVGNDLHMFTQDGDETPELIIDGFYQHTGELSGMAADGSYHVYVNEEGSDRDAFLQLDNNGASTLVLAENTSGLEGLAAGAGLSNTAIGLAALAALLAGGIALLRPHHSSEHTPAVPEPGVAHDRVGTVQGIIAEHGVTNDNRPLLTGFATRNSVLRVYADGKLIGSTVVGPDGHWQMVPDAPLADGSHDLTFSASYGDRESAQSRPINFVVDTTPPAAPLVDIVDGKEQDLSHGGLTNNGNIDMSGHGGEPGDVVKLYDGDKLVGSAIVGADGSWSVPIKLIGDGEHDLSASYTDPAGNEGPHSPLAPVELDTTPPPVPVGTITDGKDQDLTHGGLTNNGDIDMSGNGGAPGDVVKLYDGDKLIGSAIVGADGSWTVPAELVGDGEHDLSASYTDPAGNEGPRSPLAPIELDTTPPDAPAISELTDGKDQDLLADDLTNNGNLVVKGTGGTQDDIVKLYDGDTLVGSAIVGADGSWTIPTDISGDGVHDLSASYTDPAGNESLHSAPAPVDLDTTPPDAPVISELTDGKDQDLLANDLTNNGNLVVKGTGGTQDDIVKLYDGDTLVGSAIVGADGSWTIPTDISGDGVHDLSASYTDPAGNESLHSAPAPVDLDTTPPDAPVISELTDGKDQDLLADDLTNNGNLVVKGTGGTQDDIVKLYDGDTLVGSAIVGADGSWTIPTDISGDGVHDLSASYTDPAGNESLHSAPAPVDLDTTPPDAPVIDKLTDGKDQDLLADDLTNNGNLVVSGSGGTKDDIVKLYDGDTLVGSAIVGADGSWTVPTDISGDGVHDLSASYTDPAGNESLHSAPAPVDLDTTPPDAPVISGLTDGKGQNLIADGLTNNGNLVVKGSGGVHNDVVRLYDGATLVGSAIVGSDGSWSIPTNLSSDGDHNLNANYTDPAGNVGPHSSPVVVDLDTTAPTTTLVLDDNAPSLSGVTEPNAIVKIYEGSTVIGSQQADINGKWSFKPTGTLADGTYHYSATAQDKLGNTSGHTANLDFKVATTVNDFDDGTAQGWVITGAHASDTYFNGSGVTLSPGGAMAAGDIMYREFVVQAGHTYNFSFSAVHWYSVGSSTIGTIGVGLNIDGSSLGNPSTIYNGTINYSWTATTSGVVKIALYTDDTNFLPTNWANFDNFTIRDAGPTGATSVSSFGVQSHEEAHVQHDDSISSLGVPHDDSSSTLHQDSNPVQHGDGSAVPYDSVANHFQQSGNELKLIDTSPVIDLSNVARQHQGEEIHTLSLEGHGNNVLNVNINDVLAIGSEDLFQQDGAKQLLIKGDVGDSVNLEAINGDKTPEQWNAKGDVTMDGTTYNVYHNADHEIDLLIQQGVQVHQQ